MMILRAPLDGCDACVFPLLRLAIVDHRLPAHERERAEEQARALIAGDLESAPDATLPRPRLRVIGGDRGDHDRSVS